MLKRLLHRPFIQRLEYSFTKDKPCFIQLHKSTNVGYNLSHSLLFHSSQPNRIVVVSNENDYVFSVINKFGPKTITSTDIIHQAETEEQFNNILKQNWRTSSASEIVEAFKNVTKFCVKHNIDISDKRFDNLVDGLVDNCEYLSKNEIADLLECMVEMPFTESYHSHNFHDLWSCLDDICCWKVVNWDIDSSLEIAKLWYKLNLGV